MNHIDVSRLLRQTLACDLYSNLVTRTTGAEIRGFIERLLEAGAAPGGPGTADGRESRDAALTVIDFSHVSMIDFSCADEIIAKLLMRYCADSPPAEAYFVFRGVTEEHWEAIEAVLERHELALIVEREDSVAIVGALPEEDRRVWEALRRLGAAAVEEVAALLALERAAAERVLQGLSRRRLVMRLGADAADADRYAIVGGAHGPGARTRERERARETERELERGSDRG